MFTEKDQMAKSAAQIVVRLDAQLRERFKEAAALTHRPGAQVIREFIREFVEESKTEVSKKTARARRRAR
jgi:predicted DNA-binding protein